MAYFEKKTDHSISQKKDRLRPISRKRQITAYHEKKTDHGIILRNPGKGHVSMNNRKKKNSLDDSKGHTSVKGLVHTIDGRLVSKDNIYVNYLNLLMLR